MQLVIPFLCLILAGCSTRTSDCSALVAKIHNNHIRWDGNFLGLEVSSMTEAEHQVLQSGSSCRSSLIAALADDSRFAVAHVLLTKIQGDSFPVSPAEWNHLQVTLHPDGHVEIPTEQKAKIQKLWIAR